MITERVFQARALLAITIVAVCLVYSRGFAGPWLYDDTPNLLENRQLDIRADVADEWRTAALSSGSGILRRPVAMASFTAEQVLQGELQPSTAKAINTLLHLVNGLLVLLLSRLLLHAPACNSLAPATRELVAVAATLLWLLHPLHLSTVLYAVQRMAQLSTLFVLLGLWVFTRYRLRWAEHGASTGEVIGAVLWMLLIFLLAILSKENGLLLPWLVAVVEFCFFRGRWAGVNVAWFARLAWLALLLPALGLLLLGLAGPDWLVGRYATRDFTLEERLLTQARLLWQYLGWLAWPDISRMGVHHDDIALSTAWYAPLTTALSVGAWLLAVAVALWLRNRLPLLLFGLAFYLVGHAAESTVWPLMLAFEHRSYLPSVGLALMVAGLLVPRLGEGERLNPLLPVGAVLLVMVFNLNLRASAWSDETTLHFLDVRNHPQSARSHYMYGNLLLRQFQQEKRDGVASAREQRDRLVAIRSHFGEAARLDPDDAAVLVTLYQLDSNYFTALGTADQWLQALRQELASRRLRPADVNALKSLFRCLAKGSCPGGPPLAEALLADLAHHHPHRAERFTLRHMYQQELGVPAQERMLGLAEGLALFGTDQRLQYRMLNDAVLSRDAGQAYEMGRQIMAGDGRRWELTSLRRVFEGPAE